MAYNTVNELFKGIADAIRTKTGKTEKIATQDMPAEIESITTGGSDEWEKITDWSHIFRDFSLMNNFKNIIKLLDTPTDMEYFASISNSQKLEESFDLIDLMKKYNFSDVKLAGHAFEAIVLPLKTEKAQDINLNLDFSNATSLSYFLSGINYPNSHDVTEYKKIEKINLTVDFNGTTGKVTDFSYLLRNTTSYTVPELNVLNINMQKCTGTSNMLRCLSNAPTLKRFTFMGSFGGSSTTSSLTLDLSTQSALTVEAFLETMTTISANTNGKTRIFKLPSALYNALTDEILDLADEKGYTLSS